MGASVIRRLISHPAIVAAVVMAMPVLVAAQQTVAADRFVDAAGVNIHLHYDHTLYRDQFPLVKERLLELGVRHVRDGLIDTTWRPYYERHNALGAAGIKGVFITEPRQTAALWAAYPSRVPLAFEAYEAPNEYNKSKDPNWAQTLTTTLQRLRGLKNDPRVARFPVYGPSLTTTAAYASLGDVSAFFDFANVHHYFGGRHPGTIGWGTDGYGSITWGLDLVNRYASGRPIVATEAGYQDDMSLTDAIPARVVGRYMPRVLLEQFRAGIVRTYLYELADFPRSGSYGLLNADGSPKPAFTAVKGLLTLLSDPGPAFTPRDLGYTVTGGSPDVHHMAFGKRDGTYFLALWLARASDDPGARQPVTAPPETVLVRLPERMRMTHVYRWQDDGAVSAETASGTTALFPATIKDELMIVELAPATPSSR
jgi:hypothetical protein